MTDQTSLLPDQPPEPRLTPLQQLAFAYIREHQPVPSDELGAAVHQDRFQRGLRGHTTDHRCGHCGFDARGTDAVYCPKCGGFMFNITITAKEVPVDGFGKIEDFRCPNRRCAYQAMMLIGVADRDKRDDVKKVEDELKRQIETTEEES